MSGILMVFDHATFWIFVEPAWSNEVIWNAEEIFGTDTK